MTTITFMPLILFTAFAVGGCDSSDATRRTSAAAGESRSVGLNAAEPKVFIGPANLLCTDTKFIDALGKIRNGTKNCAEFSAPPCSDTVTTNCRATEQHVAVDGQVLVPGNIKAGTVINGITGTLSGAPLCVSSGQQNCVADGGFYAGSACGADGSACYILPYVASSSPLKAVNHDTLVANASLMRTSVTISGVTGTLATCSANQQTGCVSDTNFKSADFTNLIATNIKSGTTIAGVAGTMIAAAGACSSTGQQSCFVTGSLYAYPTAGRCSANSSNCFIDSYVLTTQPLKAIDFDDVSAKTASFRTSLSIAGQAGTVATCSASNQTGCVTSGSYTSASFTNILASNILSGEVIAGVTGSVVASPANCSADGQQNCVATGTYFGSAVCSANQSNCYLKSYAASVQSLKAIDFDNIAANIAKITNTVTIGGSTGTLAVCTANSATDCISDATYVAGDLSNLSAANVKSGVTIAGVSGNVVPAPTNCTSNGATACTVPSTYSSYVAAASTCNALESNCLLPAYALTTQPKRAINYDNIAGNTAKFRLATTIAGISGSLADCGTNSDTGCLSTSTYKSANLTNLSAANIKSGVTIAGQAGEYPSMSYPLSNNTGPPDLENATFNAQMISSAAFEYWDSSGAVYVRAGDSDIVAGNIKTGSVIYGVTGTYTAPSGTVNAWDLRAGVVAGAVTGKLRVNCRNSARKDVFDYDGALASLPDTSSFGGGVIDFWDTIDDYNGTLAGVPNEWHSGWATTTYQCAGIESTVDDHNVWRDVTTTAGSAPSTCAATPTRCSYKDKISGLEWSKPQTAGQTWSGAIKLCDALTYNGFADWRLPTLKEMANAYAHGIKSTQGTNFIPDLHATFWQATTLSTSNTQAYFVEMADFNPDAWPKTDTSSQTVCVRP